MWKGLAVQCCVGDVGSASSSGRMDGPPVLWGRVQETKELGLCPKDRESQGRVLSKRAVWENPSRLECGEWHTKELGGGTRGAVEVIEVRD